MTAIGAAFTGLGKVLGTPSVVLWLWLANVVVALPAAMMLSDSIHDSLGASLVDEKLREGFDMAGTENIWRTPKGSRARSRRRS